MPFPPPPPPPAAASSSQYQQPCNHSYHPPFQQPQQQHQQQQHHPALASSSSYPPQRQQQQQIVMAPPFPNKDPPAAGAAVGIQQPQPQQPPHPNGLPQQQQQHHAPPPPPPPQPNSFPQAPPPPPPPPPFPAQHHHQHRQTNASTFPAPVHSGEHPTVSVQPQRPFGGFPHGTDPPHQQQQQQQQQPIHSRATMVRMGGAASSSTTTSFHAGAPAIPPPPPPTNQSSLNRGGCSIVPPPPPPPPPLSDFVVGRNGNVHPPPPPPMRNSNGRHGPANGFPNHPHTNPQPQPQPQSSQGSNSNNNHHRWGRPQQQQQHAPHSISSSHSNNNNRIRTDPRRRRHRPPLQQQQQQQQPLSAPAAPPLQIQQPPEPTKDPQPRSAFPVPNEPSRAAAASAAAAGQIRPNQRQRQQKPPPPPPPQNPHLCGAPSPSIDGAALQIQTEPAADQPQQQQQQPPAVEPPLSRAPPPPFALETQKQQPASKNHQHPQPQPQRPSPPVAGPTPQPGAMDAATAEGAPAAPLQQQQQLEGSQQQHQQHPMPHAAEPKQPATAPPCAEPEAMETDETATTAAPSAPPASKKPKTEHPQCAATTTTTSDAVVVLQQGFRVCNACKQTKRSHLCFSNRQRRKGPLAVCLDCSRMAAAAANCGTTGGFLVVPDQQLTCSECQTQKKKKYFDAENQTEDLPEGGERKCKECIHSAKLKFLCNGCRVERIRCSFSTVEFLKGGGKRKCNECIQGQQQQQQRRASPPTEGETRLSSKCATCGSLSSKLVECVGRDGTTNVWQCKKCRKADDKTKATRPETLFCSRCQNDLPYRWFGNDQKEETPDHERLCTKCAKFECTRCREMRTVRNFLPSELARDGGIRTCQPCRNLPRACSLCHEEKPRNGFGEVEWAKALEEPHTCLACREADYHRPRKCVACQTVKDRLYFPAAQWGPYQWTTTTSSSLSAGNNDDAAGRCFSCAPEIQKDVAELGHRLHRPGRTLYMFPSFFFDNVEFFTTQQQLQQLREATTTSAAESLAGVYDIYFQSSTCQWMECLRTTRGVLTLTVQTQTAGGRCELHGEIRMDQSPKRKNENQLCRLDYRIKTTPPADDESMMRGCDDTKWEMPFELVELLTECNLKETLKKTGTQVGGGISVISKRMTLPWLPKPWDSPRVFTSLQEAKRFVGRHMYQRSFLYHLSPSLNAKAVARIEQYLPSASPPFLFLEPGDLWLYTNWQHEPGVGDGVLDSIMIARKRN